MDNQIVEPFVGGVPLEDVTRFDRVEPECHFAVPAHPTVKQQLEYYSRYADTRSDPMYLRLWHSAQGMFVEWECSILPDYKVALDKITDPDATTIIMWAGNAVIQYMGALDALPKASSAP
jgi:hypothetical protein